ncbi:cysteine hydrolase family protein [Aeromicrobium sp. CTD01-1L150]|uniref:cysteine hydrolase family protein n=1 Tax=Aeromicrobium sp. CTD01-1L150 TaxID=3341830 RepID=UPI0035C0A884
MSEWLVVVDAQRVFADPGSPWQAAHFADIVAPVRELAEQHPDRVLLTRWLPPELKTGSWVEYFESWPFADTPPLDPQFHIVPELTGLTDRPTLDATTFGKWSVLEPVTGPTPDLLLAGVATDCCVLSTALAAVDAGARVRVASRACAGSTEENHDRALAVMDLYAPQITIV